MPSLLKVEELDVGKVDGDVIVHDVAGVEDEVEVDVHGEDEDEVEVEVKVGVDVKVLDEVMMFSAST